MDLRIKVGAAIDRSMSEAFRPLIQASERAKTALERTARQTSQARERESKRSARDEAKAYASAVREIEKFEREKVRAVERSAAERSRAVERHAREEVRAAQRAAREKERTEQREHARVERALAGQSRQRGAAARGIVRGVVNLGGRAARGALDIAGDIARGAGAQLDVGQHIGAAVDLQKRAIDLSNAGYMAGKSGPAGTRQSPAEIERQVRAVAQSTGQESGDVMSGLSKFVAKTGDLEAGRDMLGEMAKLAKATGASLEDVLDAAGDVSNALGDTPDKGSKIAEA
jgi:hypothetical protein